MQDAVNPHMTFVEFVSQASRNRTGTAVEGNARLAMWGTIAMLSLIPAEWVVRPWLFSGSLWFGNRLVASFLAMATNGFVVLLSLVLGLAIGLALIGTSALPPSTPLLVAAAASVFISAVVSVPPLIVAMVIAANLLAWLAAIVAAAALMVFIIWALFLMLE